MLTLTRARRIAGREGQPLPDVFPTLARHGVRIRRGELTLVVAAPGVGKSLFAGNLAVRAGLPGFYYCADTNSAGMYKRAGCMVTGWSMDDVGNAIERGNTATLDAKLRDVDRLVRFEFSAPSLDDIDEGMEAFALAYGEWPSFVVVDNLRNVFNPESPAGRESHEANLEYLQQLARQTGAAVITLHHTTGPNNDGNVPFGMTGVKDQVTAIPEMVLGLFKGDGLMNVLPLKQRNGVADPTGGTWYGLPYDPARMRIDWS